MLHRGDLGRMLAAWAVGTVSLAVAAEVLPDLSATSWWSWIAAAAATGVVGALLRPVLVVMAAAVGWLGVAVVAFVGQALVLHVALALVPGIEEGPFWTSLVAAWVTAAVSTAIVWLATAGTPESLTASLSRSRRGRRPAPPDGDVTGMLFVQLDGVPYPLLQWALQSGLMPTVRRWVDQGSHVAREWTVQLPCTTPASQLGILHGTTDGVPAFRWYDRELGRVLVANRPGDARIIEARASDGRGLLADDGASVSNLFSGDAARCSMVMSQLGFTRGSVETRRGMAWFVTRPDGLARSVSRVVAEIAREWHQAVRQRRRDVRPRIARPWSFRGLRAVTNGLLRDLNLAVVAREMQLGRRTIYVDFVDFDEVAHHAGPTRLESLAVLQDLDRVVATLEGLAASAGRRYEITLLSDHGQALGEPFESRFGESLADHCRGLMGAPVASLSDPVESWGRAGSIAEDVAAAGGSGRGLAGPMVERSRRPQEAAAPAEADESPVVLGSGNLALLYAGGPDRLTLEEIDARWPLLVPGLARHPGVCFVAGSSRREGPVAVGEGGRVVLATGAVEGVDPLGDLPGHARQVLLEALGDDRAPDLYVNSAVDPSTDEVAAFEDLVGSHGGLGGPQDRGMVVAPSGLWAARGPVVGAASLHRELVAMLERLGHRAGG